MKKVISAAKITFTGRDGKPLEDTPLMTFVGRDVVVNIKEVELITISSIPISSKTVNGAEEIEYEPVEAFVLTLEDMSMLALDEIPEEHMKDLSPTDLTLIQYKVKNAVDQVTDIALLERILELTTGTEVTQPCQHCSSGKRYPPEIG